MKPDKKNWPRSIVRITEERNCLWPANKHWERNKTGVGSLALLKLRHQITRKNYIIYNPPKSIKQNSSSMALNSLLYVNGHYFPTSNPWAFFIYQRCIWIFFFFTWESKNTHFTPFQVKRQRTEQNKQ